MIRGILRKIVIAQVVQRSRHTCETEDHCVSN